MTNKMELQPIDFGEQELEKDQEFIEILFSLKAQEFKKGGYLLNVHDVGYGAIYILEKETVKEEYKHWMSDDTDIIAETGSLLHELDYYYNKEIGEKVCVIARIEVNTHFRRLGLGSDALTQIRHFAKSAGCKNILLDSYPIGLEPLSKEELQTFYESNGFTSYRTIEGKYHSHHYLKMDI